MSFVNGEGVSVGIGGVLCLNGEVEKSGAFVGGGKGEHFESVSVGLEHEVPNPVMVENGEQMGEVWQRHGYRGNGRVHGRGKAAHAKM